MPHRAELIPDTAEYRAEQALLKHLSLRKATLQNKSLARELQIACKSRDGILTYSEFLQIDQFGKYGYHETRKYHGETNVETRWAESLAILFARKNYETIIEFGSGNGDLGIQTIIEGKNLSLTIPWHGIDIREQALKNTLNLASTSSINISNISVSKTIRDIPQGKKSLVVFPNNLSSIPPEIFTTDTNPQNSRDRLFPNSMIGITVENGILEEHIIPDKIMNKKDYH